jgi:hypothetical protein
MFFDLQYILLWWLIILFLGFLTLPLIQFAFNKFIDLGYIFSKTSSLALITFTLFVLSSFKLLTFTQSSILIICFFLVLANYWYLSKKNNYKIFLNNLKKENLLLSEKN